MIFILGHNQLIARFKSATRPNLELKNPTFVGRKIQYMCISSYLYIYKYLYQGLF